MHKYIFAIGALAVFGTACVKDSGCDSSDTAGCEDTDDSGSTTGCGDYDGSFALGIDTAACSAPTENADGDIVADGSGTALDASTDSVSVNCDEVGYWFDVFTLGWASDVEINIYQDLSNGWEESGQHTAVEILNGSATGSYQVYDAEGWWDFYYLELNTTDDYTAVDAENTLFVCNDSRLSTLDFYLVASSEDGSSNSCVQWGQAGSGYYDSVASDCSFWD